MQSPLTSIHCNGRGDEDQSLRCKGRQASKALRTL